MMWMRETVINKMGLKGAYFKHMRVKKCREDGIMQKLQTSVKSS